MICQHHIRSGWQKRVFPQSYLSPKPRVFLTCQGSQELNDQEFMPVVVASLQDGPKGPKFLVFRFLHSRLPHCTRVVPMTSSIGKKWYYTIVYHWYYTISLLKLDHKDGALPFGFNSLVFCSQQRKLPCCEQPYEEAHWWRSRASG